MSIEIKLTDGELREGETITLSVDFSGDTISPFYTDKRWVVFAERNVKWDTILEEYYYDVDQGVVFEASNSNDILIEHLVLGRLFSRFTYKDLLGNDQELTKVFKVLPNYTLNIPSDIIQNEEVTFDIEKNLTNVNTTFTFSHDSSVETISGDSLTKTIATDGYYVLTTDIDWTGAEYSSGEKVVWDSTPEDLLTTTSMGYFGGGSIDNQTLVESISANYLVKQDLNDYIDLDISFSKSVDNTIDAPLRGFVKDESTYNYTLTGNHRIEYVELDYGDGIIERNYDINFFKEKTYKRSGVYKLKYTVFTVHELVETTYRQSLSKTITVTVDPFFASFFRSLFDKGIYNSKGFIDFTNAWGIQMDRLYNEAQTLLESLDSSTIDNKFLASFSTTYGDFSEIYEKVGYKRLSESYEDDERFDFFANYNFFDRVETGDLTDGEKQEFVRYIQESRNRLSRKGTPEAIEKIISFFALNATVKELWTQFRSLKPEYDVLIDEVFDGNKTQNKTGLTKHRVSLPSSDNEDNLVVDRTDDAYIEINTYDNVYNTYYTDTTEYIIKNGKKYIKLNFT